MKGRTTFMVAQRFSLLRRADFIVVLHKGKIAQIGTHDELSARPGLYATALQTMREPHQNEAQRPAPRIRMATQ